MMTRPHRGRSLALLILCLVLMTGCTDGCKGSKLPSSQQLNSNAIEAKREAIAPRLEKVAKAHPELEADVRDVVDNWSKRPERETFQKSLPLLEVYQADHPTDTGVESQIASWRRRITEFEQK